MILLAFPGPSSVFHQTPRYRSHTRAHVYPRETGQCACELGPGDRPQPRGAFAQRRRHLRNAVLRILRPAEAAVRRLVIIAARDVVVVVKPVRPVIITTSTTTKTGKAGNAAERLSALPLIDPLKRFPVRPVRRRAKAFPRITFIGLTEPTPIPDGWFPAPDDQLDAAPLCRRLKALKRALDDLDRQARRLARWKARRDLGLNRSPRFNPMRPGRPPGYRKRAFHEVDAVLRECHVLALALQRSPGGPDS
jgi:hypothetical protein